MTTSMNASVSSWLASSVLYQVYPASFADSDGDGIGDLAGIRARLDHLAWLGVDAIWLSPCFDSPFADGGYDIRDHYAVAPRYGTTDDLVGLVEEARSHGIRVLLDLVPGHTSDTHPRFRSWAEDPDDHRYVHSPRVGSPAAGWAPVPGSRGGYYLLNYFPCQPALNYGYARLDPREPWRQPVDADGPQANRAELRSIMGHWLALGVSGFRVDMPASLVKDDPGHVETRRLWGEARRWLDRQWPDAVLLAEWGDPAVALPAGFHGDFFLHFGGPALRSLWHNGTGTHDPSWGDAGRCYFDPAGGGGFRTFLDEWRAAASATGGGILLPTSNHDFTRLVTAPRTADHARGAFVFLLTWPTVPAIYYGDEIGMRYRSGLPDTEGSVVASTYDRTGSRTPMQWAPGPGAGFSSAPADRLYLPVDPEPGRPDVASQRFDEESLLHLVRRLVRLRRQDPALHPDAAIDVLHDGYPLVYERGGARLVVVNPADRPAQVELGRGDWDGAVVVEGRGVRVRDGRVEAEGRAYGILARAGDTPPTEPDAEPDGGASARRPS
ncbi:MAG: alpha-amylase family glycosyl hydrolase [Dermatophilaceae bacterium]